MFSIFYTQLNVTDYNNKYAQYLQMYMVTIYTNIYNNMMLLNSLK